VARRTGVSHTTVHRIWQAHDLKPHWLEAFKFITDPEAEEHIHAHAPSRPSAAPFA
jgi:hypothetical protein